MKGLLIPEGTSVGGLAKDGSKRGVDVKETWKNLQRFEQHTGDQPGSQLERRMADLKLKTKNSLNNLFL